MDSKNKKNNIVDIAKIANVSPGTVSNALNNRKGVSETKRQEILQIAKELGYDRAPAQKLEKTIRYVIVEREGIIVNDSFSTELIYGVESKAREYGYELLVTTLSYSDIRSGRAADILSDDNSSGIIVLATEMFDEDLHMLDNVMQPVVMMSNTFKDPLYCDVTMNNEMGAYKATEYLIEKGHRDIMFLNSNLFLHNYLYRKKGFYMALMNYGLDVTDKREIRLTPTMEEAHRFMSQYLRDKTNPVPTAFVAINDHVCFGAIRALTTHGYNVPKDVSIIGFDDIPYCEISTPSLTTMRVDKKEMGELAAKLLVDQIEGKISDSLISVVQHTSLVERESVREIKGVKKIEPMFLSKTTFE